MRKSIKLILSICICLTLVACFSENTKIEVEDKQVTATSKQFYLINDSSLKSYFELVDISYKQENDDYIFTLNTKSDAGLSVIAFNPPDGDKYREDLKPTTSVDEYTITVSKDILSSVDDIVISFYADDYDYIDLLIKSELVLGIETDGDTNTDNIIDIKDKIMIYDSDYNKDYSLNSFSYTDNGDVYTFFFNLILSEGVDALAVYNPPNGSLIRDFYEISSDGSYCIDISKDVFDATDEINFDFFGNGDSLTLSVRGSIIFENTQ